MNNPKISIIIPVYKVEKYLHRCLDSIAAQTFVAWECILIDDGSPDNSGKICDEYAARDMRFRVFHQKNQGVSVARNLGIEKSKGQYIAFVDSDDWVSDDYFDVLERNAGKADLLYFSNTNYNEDGDRVTYHIRPFYSDKKNILEQELLHLFENLACWDYYGFTWNKLFRADIIRNANIRFIPSLATYEDEAFTNDYIQHIKSLMVIDNAIYNYSWKQSGLTFRAKTKKNFYDLFDNAITMAEVVESKDVRDFFFKRAEMFMFLNNALPSGDSIFKVFISLQKLSKRTKYTFSYKRFVINYIINIGKKIKNKLNDNCTI